MFIACPHCHELVAARPQPRQSPELCPRCGGALQVPAGTATEMPAGPPARSFATLLRGTAGPQPAPDIAQAVPAAMEPEVQSPAAPAPLTDTADDSTDSATPPADAAETTTEPEPLATSIVNADAAETESAIDDSDGSRSSAEPLASPASSPAYVATNVPTASRARGPSFTRASRTTPVRTDTTKQWLVLSALSLLLVIQVLLADRARLAADAGWRPLLVSMCGMLRCSLPPWREPQAFVMLSRDVRPVAGAPGTLQAQATFRNDARWPQPWPVLLLTLKDADGRTLGARALTPGEYLDAAVDSSEIASGQSAQVAVRIREPSASVVAYSFDFR